MITVICWLVGLFKEAIGIAITNIPIERSSLENRVHGTNTFHLVGRSARKPGLLRIHCARAHGLIFPSCSLNIKQPAEGDYIAK